MNIIYFGTPRFSAEVLNFLLKNGIEIAAVVTKPDKPVGRGQNPVPVPVKALVESSGLGIPVFQPEVVSSPEFAPTLRKFNPDLFVVVAYGEILKKDLLEMPTKGCINLHASLLPKYRGAAPIQRSIIEGEKESGVTIMHLARKMDAGDIIESQSIPIDLTTTYAELEKAICSEGSRLLLKVIKDIEKGVVKRYPQDHSLATYAPKIELEDCEVRWGGEAKTVHNLIRGVNPEPGAWCWVKIKNEPKRLKIYSSLPVEELYLSPGVLKVQGQDVFVGCLKGSLKLLEVQLEGKKRMLAADLFRGIPTASFL
ncbi:Methionyl-tRNA formyltransferase [Chlamydiales bacterium STE3]|nr:Methionyl-tRNA formyltransferase [Chlamydiales bacterium STE3]